MPEWITPLLRVLAPMPSLGICSTRNTSLQRCETARATAHPTTPPPMMTIFARSTANRILEVGGGKLLEVRGWCLKAGDKMLRGSGYAECPILAVCARVGHSPELRRLEI